MVVIFELGPEGRLLAEECRPPLFIFPLTFLAGYNQVFTVENFMACSISGFPNH